MKLKTLKKRIRKLEKRLREGPTKLAKLKRNLAALETKKEAAARARLAARSVKKSEPIQEQKPRANAGTSAKPMKDTRPVAPAKAKRVLSLSPERRAQLSAAMKARWAAKKAAAATTPRPDPLPHNSALEESAPPSEFRPEGT
jgi:chromosome segregation ATPase